MEKGNILINFNTDDISADEVKDLFSLIDATPKIHGIDEKNEKRQHIFFTPSNVTSETRGEQP